jgi:predicted amidohydrolase YtcJ
MCVICHWSRFVTPDRHAGPAATAAAPTRRGVLWGSALLAGAAMTRSWPAAAQTAGPADLIFRGGPIYTLDPQRPWAEAVAVRGREIVHVGGADAAAALAGPATRIVDLRGRLLLPGFVEAHIHPLFGAAVTRGLDLQFDSRDEVLAALRAYAANAPADGPIRGFGWRYTVFPASGPQRADLDAIWPDRPVFLIAIDGHGAWVNSKALALAGITRDTTDPMPGFSYFQRDPATGAATGMLVEVPAMMQVMTAIGPMSRDFIAQSLDLWLPKASTAGITAIFDAGTLPLAAEDGMALYQDAERRGRLPFRVVGSYYHNDPAIDPVPIIQGLRARFQSELVQARVLKLNMDGGDFAYTAAMLAPYSDNPGTSGETVLTAALARDIVVRADALGIDIHVHSYGDRATRITLDAIAAAIAANPPRDRRNALAHCVLIDPADLPRFAALGAVGQFSAQWAVPDITFATISQRRWGEERASRMYPINSLQRAGGRLAFGTDWPAAGHYSTYRPLEAIEIATTRRELNKPDQTPLAPGERVDLATALRASTLGGAWQIGMEGRIGSIETGKLADLVVLDRNLFETPPSDIHKAEVLMTVMNGRPVHDRLA